MLCASEDVVDFGFLIFGRSFGNGFPREHGRSVFEVLKVFQHLVVDRLGLVQRAQLLIDLAAPGVGRDGKPPRGQIGIHASELLIDIVQRGGRYLVEDLDTPGGTFVNDLRIAEATPLRSGDAIRLGRALLRFGERRK